MPFAVLVAVYLTGSSVRQATIPGDELVPPPPAMAEAWSAMALAEDSRTGDVLFWTDTRASLAPLGTRVPAFDKVRDDPHAPDRFGATDTYDITL